MVLVCTRRRTQPFLRPEEHGVTIPARTEALRRWSLFHFDCLESLDFNMGNHHATNYFVMVSVRTRRRTQPFLRPEEQGVTIPRTEALWRRRLFSFVWNHWTAKSQHVHPSLTNPYCNQSLLLVALVEIRSSSELFGSPLAPLQQ